MSKDGAAVTAPKMDHSQEKLQGEPRNYPEVAVQIPRVYLPGASLDPARWAVVACDQFTSQPEYWQQVETLVGDQPSTLNLILPEYYLGKPGEAERIQNAQAKMREYLQDGVLEPHDGMVYVERSVEGRTRRGLVLCLDLEKYDYNKGSQSLIRATEGTILDRLPPRMKIRQGAVLELPHILVLIDDPDCTVIEPVSQLAGSSSKLEKVYDFDLMMDSGHLTGYSIQDPALEKQVIAALTHLADPEVFAKKYGVGDDQSVLLFAMGDGNHSLATAKAVWEQMKPTVGLDHPARYALVEIENVHDQGLEFEPIHRVLFGLKTDILSAMKEHYGSSFTCNEVQDCVEMIDWVEAPKSGRQAIGVTWEHKFFVIEFLEPSANLAVGTLQPFIEAVVKSGQAHSVDYVHGKCVICKLTAQAGNVGFFLPNMQKSDLFKTVILDGALPKKTFSMGEAREKRFYMETRRIA